MGTYFVPVRLGSRAPRGTGGQGAADGGELLSTGGDGAILFDRQSGLPLWHAREGANLSHGVWLAGEGFALASADGSVRLGETESGKFAHTLWTRFMPDFTSRISLTAE